LTRVGLLIILLCRNFIYIWLMTFLETLSNIWQSVVNFIFPVWVEFIAIISDITKLPEEYAHRVVFGFILYILVLLMLGLFHKKIFKKWKIIERKRIYEYDRIWYLIARSMYFYNEHLKQNGQVGKLIHWTRTILKLENKDYVQNKEKIFSDISKLEMFFNQEVVPKKVLKKITMLDNKIKFWNTFQSFVWWWIVVLTLGLYFFSWKKLDLYID